MAMSRFALIAAVGVTAVLVGRVDAGRPLVATTEQTPLPDREYCPSHQHLEERLPVSA